MVIKVISLHLLPYCEMICKIIQVGEIRYQIRVDPGTPLYPNDDKNFTTDNDIFQVTLDRRGLYPVGFVNDQPYTIFRNNKNFTLTAKTYSDTYHLSDILGILVAEQMRFNTFNFFYLKKYGTNAMFSKLSQYKKSYQNWRSRQGLQPQVEILLEYV